jgi:demethoxyubiquinone hydroxylase (CLK1/Coq7/Cat5 family)
MDASHHRERLIHILQGAYSGELAAGFAYCGHWKSLKNPIEIEKIQQIENEEWAHRERVGQMLASLKAKPRKSLELKLRLIGRAIGAACHMIGWFLPMYFAGRLESGNVEEYLSAAFHAGKLGLSEYESDLMEMAKVEREHELYFLSVISGHSWLPFMQSVFKWGLPSLIAAQEAEAESSSRPVN